MQRRNARRACSILVVVAAAVALVACSGPAVTPSSGSPSPAVTPSSGTPSHEPEATPAPSASGSGTYDACTLLPAEKLSKIVGGAVQGNVMPGGGWMIAQCAWNTSKSSFLVSVGTPASIEKNADPSAPDAKGMLANYKQTAMAGGKATDLVGVGDGAVQTASGIGAVKAGNYIELTVMSPGLSDKQLVEILRLALARL